MTSAPANLLAVRNLLLTYLNVDKNKVRADDLEPAEVGIVGDVNHRGGYHCGSNRVVTNDYSVVESSRDRTGLTLNASALDVGMFEVRSGGKVHNLPSFSVWCVGQCVADAPDTRDIREIIYSPDGQTVRRWDRLGRRTSGDSSHLFHTHFSFFRDATKAGRDQTPLFRRYLASIGLVDSDELLEDGMDVNLTPTAIGQVATKVWSATWGPETAGGRLAEARDEARKARLTGEAVLAAVKGLDTKAVIARIDAVAGEERQRDEALAELVRQYRSGALDAEAVVNEIAARLAG
ncbi:hypothetical protein AB0J77_14750 [Micromonospora tulbaghiae]|uniref:hypothetical protein n=1 Tax=Micromonospora tulbaghiae TaxID=479978 RepID=UPI00342AB1FF